jgi:hypothetical protein
MKPSITYRHGERVTVRWSRCSSAAWGHICGQGPHHCLLTTSPHHQTFHTLDRSHSVELSDVLYSYDLIWLSHVRSLARVVTACVFIRAVAGASI